MPLYFEIASIQATDITAEYQQQRSQHHTMSICLIKDFQHPFSLAGPPEEFWEHSVLPFGFATLIFRLFHLRINAP